jgi:hypothetical protein
MDYVLNAQNRILHSDLSLTQTFALLEVMEPIFEKMYDLGQTDVVPVRDLPPLHEMFESYY